MEYLSHADLIVGRIYVVETRDSESFIFRCTSSNKSVKSLVVFDDKIVKFVHNGKFHEHYDGDDWRIASEMEVRMIEGLEVIL